MKNITLRQMRIFNAVAKHLSFVRAAEQFHISSPAVTSQVKEIERQIGLVLFERHGKKMMLSKAGEFLYESTQKVLASFKDAENAFARFQRLETGTLTIGLVDTAQYFLIPLLGKFYQNYQGIELKLVLANREQLVKKLSLNEVDIAVMGRPPKEIVTQSILLTPNPLAFVATSQHPLAKANNIPTKTLINHSFLVRELGSGTRAAMQRFFDEHGIQPKNLIQIPSNETIKQAVMAGLGIGFLSLHTIAFEHSLNKVSILQVANTPIQSAWYLLYTSTHTLSPVAEAFRKFLIKNTS